MKLRLCLHTPNDQSSVVTHLVDSSSYASLRATAHSKWLTSAKGHCALRIIATTPDGAFLFEVHSEESFQKLAQLQQQRGDAVTGKNTTTGRVRLAVVSSSEHDHHDGHHQHHRHLVAPGDSPEAPASPSCASSPRTPSEQQQAAGVLQPWDEQAVLRSIKKSVALWHFGSRLEQQHPAAAQSLAPA